LAEDTIMDMVTVIVILGVFWEEVIITIIMGTVMDIIIMVTDTDTITIKFCYSIELLFGMFDVTTQVIQQSFETRQLIARLKKCWTVQCDTD
jgi:hypothetical protein